MNAQTSGPGPSATDQPWLVWGNPTEAELAAVVAAVTAATTAAAASGVGAPAPSTSSSSAWSAYWRSHRAPLPPSPGAWRASGQPRG